MATWRIRPLDQETEKDFFDFFDHRAFTDDSPYAPCYCNCFQLTAEEVREGIGKRADTLKNETGDWKEGLRLALRESAEGLIRAGRMHGYLAYEGDIAIGWCNAGDRQTYIRVGAFHPGESKEDDVIIAPGEAGKVKSLVCFEIAPGYRGKGVAKALLQRVLADAAAEGYEAVEVYPQLQEGFTTLDFNGPIAMYQNAGFHEIARKGKNIVMQKRLKD